MIRKVQFICGFFLFGVGIVLPAQEHGLGYNPDVIRGEVWIELEPVYGAYVDEEYPLDPMAASRRALEESALFYSAMIYGWSFHYDIGERARQISENLELQSIANISFGDPGLRATDVEIRDMRVRLWTDYRLTNAQKRRMQIWRTGTIRNAQAIGYGPLGGPAEFSDWLTVKKTALEDAARAAIRTMLRGSERNRPKEVTGFISLAAFPRYFMESGQWAVSARFHVQITRIIPFAAY